MKSAIGRLLGLLRQPDPPMAACGPAYRPAPIGLHGHEPATEPARVADQPGAAG